MQPIAIRAICAVIGNRYEMEYFEYLDRVIHLNAYGHGFAVKVLIYLKHNKKIDSNRS